MIGQPSRIPTWLAAAAIALACWAAYANTFAVPLVADDLPSIADNPTIRRLWPLSGPLHPPGFGLTVQGRPLLNLSLAVNYAISGTAVWSYHLVNLLIHVLAALTLFGILRRAFVRPAGWALAFALFWAVHPLQTESVTYLVQRGEALMGLFYLLTLYGFIRGTEAAGSASPGSRSSKAWLAASAFACLLGMGTKEVMVSAPVIVLFYDVWFVAGSLRAAWRRRGGYYLALALTWVPLAILAWHAGSRGDASGPGHGLTFTQYWLTQPDAIGRYLRLAFWPVSQVFYYGTVWAASAAAVAPALGLIGLLVAATGYGLVRRDRPGFALAGFLGLWFFAILAPTSLVPGRSQTVAEHRMYLALIPVIGVAALSLRWCGRRWLGRVPPPWTAGLSAGFATALIVALGIATHVRNRDYATARRLYAHDVALLPDNPATHGNLGTAYLREGDFAEAARELAESVRLGSQVDVVESNLGAANEGLGRLGEAAAHYRAALRLAHGPDFFAPQYDLFRVTIEQGHTAEAVREMAATLRIHPERAKVTLQLARGWTQTGSVERALLLYQALVECYPGAAELRNDFGIAWAVAGHPDRAVDQYRLGLRIAPHDAELHYNLAMAWLTEHRTEEARKEFAAALRQRPDFAPARRMLQQVGRGSAANVP